jgi:hypothetical protein
MLSFSSDIENAIFRLGILPAAARHSEDCEAEEDDSDQTRGFGNLAFDSLFKS